MTAEVAVLNKHGVALAADSAVTVTGPEGLKIYNTVNKLFALSKFFPVGIMVYSSAEVMTFPVETVIKHFRSAHLGSSELESLGEYEDRFRHFLESDSVVFTRESRLQHCLQVAASQLSGVWQELNRIVSQESVTEVDLFLSRRTEFLKEVLSELNTKPLIKGGTAAFAKELRDNVKRDLLPSIQEMLSAVEFLTLSKSDEKLVLDILVNFLLREDSESFQGKRVFRGSETGFVIAGFGSTEFFPSYGAFEFVWALDGVAKYSSMKRASVTVSNGAIIAPFAQRDVIQTFIEGKHPDLKYVIQSALDEAFEALLDDLDNDPESSKFLRGIHRSVSDRVDARLQQWTSINHISRTLKTIQTLPKEELGVFAEALVNVTIHKRRSSPDAETVGPPTDVAVISKGDGFIWLRRKHYFEPALNPAFIERYLRN